MVATMADARRDRVGQMLLVGIEGPVLDGPVRELLQEIRPGGVVLFRRNCESTEQIASLTRSIRGLFEPAPVLAVDEEGGRVTRLTPPLPPLPPAADLGRLAMPASSQWFGALIGRALRTLGFHIDFAPVVDLSRPGASDGIGDRAFSDTPEVVAGRAGAFLQGLAEAGVAGCLKHFPGHGGASADSHLELPLAERTPEETERALQPYRLLRKRTPLAMVAHIHDPALASAGGLPASLDRRVVTEILREEIGFGGVIVADDLEMGAVAARAPFGDLAVEAIRAGNDQMLVCERADHIQAAWEGLQRALDSGDLDAAQVDRSLARIAAFKEGRAAARPDEPFHPEELAVAVDEMRDLSAEVERALRRQGT